jgi:hypothetical protein
MSGKGQDLYLFVSARNRIVQKLNEFPEQPVPIMLWSGLHRDVRQLPHFGSRDRDGMRRCLRGGPREIQEYPGLPIYLLAGARENFACS